MKLCCFDSFLVYVPLRRRCGLHHRTGTNKSISHELESNLSLKVCRMNVAFVCLRCEAPRLLWLPICCLSASLSLCQPINLHALCCHLSLLVPGRNIFSLSKNRKRRIMWWNKINTQRGPNHSHSLPFISSLIFSATHIKPITTYLSDSFTSVKYGDDAFVLAFCFSSYLWPHSFCDVVVQKNGSIPPSMGWKSEN